MTKEKKREIKETFASLEEMLLQTGSAEGIVKAPEFSELVAKAKKILSEFRQEVFLDTPVNDFRNEIENAIVVIEACMSLVGDEKNAETFQVFLCKAKGCLRTVNSYLEGW